MMAFPNSGFLSEASEELRTMLAAQATELTLDRGDVLFEQGDPGEALYAILSGKLEVSFLAMSGRKLSLRLMRAGEVFGEIALFDSGPRTATVTAAEPAKVLRVRHKDVMEQIRKNPDLAVDLIRLAGVRMRWMGDQLNEQVFLPMPIRLARKLLHWQVNKTNRRLGSRCHKASWLNSSVRRVKRCQKPYRLGNATMWSKPRVEVCKSTISTHYGNLPNLI